MLLSSPRDTEAREPGAPGRERQAAWSWGRWGNGAPEDSPLRSSRSHTVTMGRECLRWWMSHRDKVCTLCCELLNSDSFFSSAASEKADIPPTPRSRRRTRWGLGEESFAALAAASPPHPTLPHAQATAGLTPETHREPARWPPVGCDVPDVPEEAGPQRHRRGESSAGKGAGRGAGLSRAGGRGLPGLVSS